MTYSKLLKNKAGYNHVLGPSLKKPAGQGLPPLGQKMKKENELENELRSSTRRYLCYEHEGAKALIRLSNTIQQIKGTGLLTETRILETIDEVLSEPPGFKDPQDLAATIAVKLMKFQHAAKRKITAVEINSRTYDESEYPSWSVNILLGKEED